MQSFCYNQSVLGIFLIYILNFTLNIYLMGVLLSCQGTTHMQFQLMLEEDIIIPGTGVTALLSIHVSARN